MAKLPYGSTLMGVDGLRRRRLALGEPGKGPSRVGVAMLAAPSSTFMAKLSHGSTSTEEAGEDIARRVVQGPKMCVDGYGSRSAFSYGAQFIDTIIIVGEDKEKKKIMVCF